jgi:hypothetical protein
MLPHWGDGPDVTYYIIKYATKNQKELENLAALQLSVFKKNINRESLLPNDLMAKVQRRQRISNKKLMLQCHVA